MRASAAELARLRRFRWVRAQPGHESVYWDQLVATVPCADEEAVREVLACLGAAEGGASGYVGAVEVEGSPVMVSIARPPVVALGRLEVVLAIVLDALPKGASTEEVERALRIEERLDRLGAA